MNPELKIGLLGLDTSHAEHFTRLIQQGTVPGGRVTCAFPTPSADLAESRDRVQGFTDLVRNQFGVRIASSIAEVCAEVDAVMLLAVDGRPRLEMMREVLRHRKPVFMDKPVAASLADAVAIYRLAEEMGVPVMSSSAVRFWPGILDLAAAEPGRPHAALSIGPAHIMAHHPDLFFYGIHPLESLFTVLGPDCVQVSRVTTATTSIVTGVWSDGALGTLHAIHEGAKGYQVIRFGRERIAQTTEISDYEPMLHQIMRFFQTGRSPIAPRETLAIYAFMQAADESKARGGQPVTLREVMLAANCPEEWLPPALASSKMPEPTASKKLPMPGSGDR